MTVEEIEQLIARHPVVVFAKGSKQQPMCGFSARAMEILERTGRSYQVVNVFDEEDTLSSLVGYSKWPTTPQVFVKGELLGGSDTLADMLESGELQRRMAAAFGG